MQVSECNVHGGFKRQADAHRGGEQPIPRRTVYTLLGDTVPLGDFPVHEAQHGRGAKVRAKLDLRALRWWICGMAKWQFAGHAMNSTEVCPQLCGCG